MSHASVSDGSAAIKQFSQLIAFEIAITFMTFHVTWHQTWCNNIPPAHTVARRRLRIQCQVRKWLCLTSPKAINWEYDRFMKIYVQHHQIRTQCLWVVPKPAFLKPEMHILRRSLYHGWRHGSPHYDCYLKHRKWAHVGGMWIFFVCCIFLTEVQLCTTLGTQKPWSHVGKYMWLCHLKRVINKLDGGHDGFLMQRDGFRSFGLF